MEASSGYVESFRLRFLDFWIFFIKIDFFRKIDFHKPREAIRNRGKPNCNNCAIHHCNNSVMGYIHRCNNSVMGPYQLSM